MGEDFVTNKQPYTVGTFKWNFGYWEGEYYGPVLISAPTGTSNVVGSLYDAQQVSTKLDAQTKALAKARDMKTNVAEFFGDGRKTVHMLRDTVNRLGKAYSLFRKRRYGAAAKELGIGKPKGAANHWLEYTYGWSPLLSDAKALAELAAQHLGLGGRPPRFTATGSSVFSKKKQMNANPNNPVTWAYGQLKGYYWQYDYEILCHAGLLCEVEYTSAQLAAQLGYGLTDPALLAWELTPFSFVFDWFVDVGSWLESMGSLQGLKVKTGYTSITVSCEGQAWGGTVDNSNRPLVGLSPRVPFNFRNYNRQLWTGSITGIRMPLFDGLNARRLVTSAALWRQRTRGDREPGGYHP